MVFLWAVSALPHPYCSELTIIIFNLMIISRFSKETCYQCPSERRAFGKTRNYKENFLYFKKKYEFKRNFPMLPKNIGCQRIFTCTMFSTYSAIITGRFNVICFNMLGKICGACGSMSTIQTSPKKFWFYQGLKCLELKLNIN